MKRDRSIRVTDAAILEAIDAELFRGIYEAERLARLRYMGRAVPPEPNPLALAMLRR